MRRAILIAGMAKQIPDLEGDYFGIDRGAFIALHQGFSLQAAIGDFDSITKKEREELEKSCPMVVLPTHKNETDSEAAVKHVLSLGYDSILLYGCLGGRIDHELANLRLMTQRRYPLTLMNEKNQLEVLNPGTYTIFKTRKYLSFLALEPSCISEAHVAYPLDHQRIDMQDIYTISNEIEDQAIVTIHEGRVMMMQSDD
ncbi:thiamine diphosphokinase [Clostridiaceae bacterium DONG20-135]|uniref:Thiamine diphosphokinase n=1 Tax=Copranaerobaculum intestinale TaxID=2692629 RepID=A0A6N8U6F8_9FIRM|nr:thiamine diphosphokinase [Copranaerobaculum intestinale]MXQ73420.1 thiamine diphosphokinase [Copranaerobaculum intestinale]